MSKSIHKPVLRYANCWEHIQLIDNFNLKLKHSHIFSIGSGGDNAFYLNSFGPKKLFIVDCNIYQIYLIELKMAAIDQLNRIECLEFLGFTYSKQRLEFYASIKNSLSISAQKYWDSNLKMIEEGIVFFGKFEKYLKYFSKYLMPFIHSKNTINQLFENKSELAQKEFYSKIWNNKRWKFLLKIFFGRFLMGRLGRDPQFLKYVDVNVSEFIFDITGQHIQSVHSQYNPYLHFILKGNFGNYLPAYLEENYFLYQKNNLNAIHLVHSDLLSFKSNENKIDFWNLSNVFEYMSNEELEKQAIHIKNQSNDEATLLYWNLMAKRNLKDIYPSIIDIFIEPEIREKDYGFFYNHLYLQKIYEK